MEKNLANPLLGGGTSKKSLTLFTEPWEDDENLMDAHIFPSIG